MKTSEDLQPRPGAPLAEVPADDAASVAAKAARARAAQPAWPATPLAERAIAIARFRARRRGRARDARATLTQEVGKPIRAVAQRAERVARPHRLLPRRGRAATAPETVFADGGMTERIGHDPLGVVANISAWNYPYFVGGNVFVPALLTGNAVLYKPSEYATLTGLHIARLLHEAGVPDDVFMTLVGAGDVGAALLEQPVDGVFFTGSVATGAKIAQAVGPRMVRLQLELGGKDPTYVADDADAKAAAESLADGAMYNTGQSCCSVERIYVHERIHDAFVDPFVATVAGFRSATRSTTTPTSARSRARRSSTCSRRRSPTPSPRARRSWPAASAIARAGNWFEPTVLTGVDHTMALMRDESFGPIIGIQKVASDDEALALMNDTRYGLTAGVYTRDEARAAKLLARVNAGSVYWNCCDRVSPRLPWSGHGDSGVGVTLSTYGIQAFTRPRAWHLRSP